MQARQRLLDSLDRQRRGLDATAAAHEFDRHRQMAVSMLLDGRVHRALDVHAVSALIDDLAERSMLDNVLIVIAGEFGRTPRVFTYPGAKSKLPGRDHWGAVQSVFFAGGGVKGGTVIGASDRIGAYPSVDPQKPENMAATIYHALGLPQTIAWKDSLARPHHVYHGEPIRRLT